MGLGCAKVVNYRKKYVFAGVRMKGPGCSYFCSMNAVLVILGLILLNGFFAMAEAALIASHPFRFAHLARKGKWQAQIALRLVQDPSRFLSSTQLGITLVSIGAGAYSGVELANLVSEWLAGFPILERYAVPAGFTLVILIITYLSMIIGELVPKTIGIAHAESIALFLAPAIQVFYYLMMPFISLLSASTRFLLWVLRVPKAVDRTLTLEDLKILIENSRQHGVIEQQALRLVNSFLRTSKSSVESLLTHRTDLVWVPEDADKNTIVDIIKKHPHTGYPVCRSTLDDVVGIVYLKDLLPYLTSGSFSLRELIKPPLYVPLSMLASELLQKFKKTGIHVALVMNEYGSLEGIATLHDVMESIFGNMPPMETSDPEIVRRPDGSYLVDGLLQNSKWAELLQISDLHPELTGGYHTLGGFIMQQLGRVPRTGDRLRFRSYVIEVVDMDGLRVDKVLIYKVPPSETTSLPGAEQF